jgi:hypothetical protein
VKRTISIVNFDSTPHNSPDYEIIRQHNGQHPGPDIPNTRNQRPRSSVAMSEKSHRRKFHSPNFDWYLCAALVVNILRARPTRCYKALENIMLIWPTSSLREVSATPRHLQPSEIHRRLPRSPHTFGFGKRYFSAARISEGLLTSRRLSIIYNNVIRQPIRGLGTKYIRYTQGQQTNEFTRGKHISYQRGCALQTYFSRICMC